MIQKRIEMKQLGIKIYILTAPDCGSSIWKASYMYFTSKNTDVFAMHTSYIMSQDSAQVNRFFYEKVQGCDCVPKITQYIMKKSGKV